MTPADFLAARRALGLSQVGMAGALGLSRSSIQAYESGRGGVSKRTELAIATLAQMGQPVGIESATPPSSPPPLPS